MKFSEISLWETQAESKAVLMPSMLGPTNLPPIESALMGTPSLVSIDHDYDQPEFLEFLEVLGPLKPTDWANSMEAHLRDQRTKQPPLDLELFLPNFQNFQRVFEEIRTILVSANGG